MASKLFIAVAGTDYSAQSTRALHAAYEQARRQAPAELHVVHAALVADATSGYGPAPFAGLGAPPAQTLDELQARLVEHLDAELSHWPGFAEAGVRVVAHVLLEAPMLAIPRLAGELQADLIVVGTHSRHGMARWLLGSVAEGVLRQAGCPVLIVPPLPHQLPVPSIEPPCPRCVEVRAQTRGAEQWCETHRERHGRRHVYHQGDRLGADTNFPLVVR